MTFANKSGKVLYACELNVLLKQFVNKMNKSVSTDSKKIEQKMPHISCHIFRHTFATRMTEMDVNPKALQKIMGHKDISTTLNIYVNSDDDFVTQELEEKVLLGNTNAYQISYQNLTKDGE